LPLEAGRGGGGGGGARLHGRQHAGDGAGHGGGRSLRGKHGGRGLPPGNHRAPPVLRRPTWGENRSGPWGGAPRPRRRPKGRGWAWSRSMSEGTAPLPAEALHDVWTVGETMVRLTPRGHTRLEDASELEVRTGGSESNVAVALARLGLRVAWASKLPRNA